MSSPEPARTTPAASSVVVTSRHGLIAQAVGEALRRRGLQVRTLAGGAAHWSQWALEAGEVVLLLDDLDSRTGVETVVAAIRRTRAPVVVLTNRPQGAVWGAVYAAGAAGVASAGQSVDELEHLVHRLLRRQPVVDREERLALLARWSTWLTDEQAVQRRLARLSPRETTVLALLADGRGVVQISEQLGVGAETVRTQVKSIRRKLRVESQLAAVAMVHQADARLPPDDPLARTTPENTGP